MSNSPEQDNGRKKIALIFVWSQFKRLEARLEAGMKDLQTMKAFWNSLGFESQHFHNCKKSVFKNKIEEVKKDYDRNNYSCLAIVVSTHGEECETKIRTEPSLFGNPAKKVIQHRLFVQSDDEDSGSDDFVVLEDDLIKKFGNSEVDTPKIFLIQSCRRRKQEKDEANLCSSGTQQEDAKDGLDTGVRFKLVDRLEDEHVPIPQGTNEINRPQPSESERDKLPYSPPCVNNSIVVFSAPSGYVSTGGYKGSILLTAVCEQLKEVSGEFSFITFMAKVNHSLSISPDKELEGKDGSNLVYKPVACIAHRLTADIRLQKQN